MGSSKSKKETVIAQTVAGSINISSSGFDLTNMVLILIKKNFFTLVKLYLQDLLEYPIGYIG